MNTLDDKWNNGDPYELFMGRWSKLIAPKFLNWLRLPICSKWLEVGCGTGALTEAIYQNCEPAHLTSIDPSSEFLIKAKQRLKDKGNFLIGTAIDLPVEDDYVDIIVSGLALNFFPNLEGALTEMKRVTKPDGTIAAYVWDYSGRMDMLRFFWNAAILVNPQAVDLDEGVRFPICNMGTLKKTFQNVGLSQIEVATFDIDMQFEDFGDYWNPFLGGQGPASAYLDSLSKNLQEELKEKIYAQLPIEADGSIQLLGRALAIKGKNK